VAGVPRRSSGRGWSAAPSGRRGGVPRAAGGPRGASPGPHRMWARPAAAGRTGAAAPAPGTCAGAGRRTARGSAGRACRPAPVSPAAHGRAFAHPGARTTARGGWMPCLPAARPARRSGGSPSRSSPAAGRSRHGPVADRRVPSGPARGPGRVLVGTARQHPEQRRLARPGGPTTPTNSPRTICRSMPDRTRFGPYPADTPRRSTAGTGADRPVAPVTSAPTATDTAWLDDRQLRTTRRIRPGHRAGGVRCRARTCDPRLVRAVLSQLS
jgi:hypothetical protein